MKRKILAVLLVLVLVIPLAACAGGGEETTVTGMVVAVEGTVISLVEMDEQAGRGDFAEGERPELPEGMDFGDFDPENFDPENFEGKMPNGENFPQRGEMPELPEGMEGFENFNPENFDPENFDGQMPDFGGKNGAGRMDFSALADDAETRKIDLADAHISVEIDGGKEGGSMDNITAGTFVTVTINAKGAATYVLVSARGGFGGFGGFGGGRNPAN